MVQGQKGVGEAENLPQAGQGGEYRPGFEVGGQDRFAVPFIFHPHQGVQINERVGDAGVRPVEVDRLSVDNRRVAEVEIAVDEGGGEVEGLP